MARLSEHHVAKCGVEGKCSVPMWSGGSPDGFCDRPAWGEQYDEGSKYAPGWWPSRDRNGFINNPHAPRKAFAPGLCCVNHGGPGPDAVRFVRDGNMWCAFMPDFENLQESHAGFGKTQDLAEAGLRARTQEPNPC